MIHKSIISFTSAVFLVLAQLPAKDHCLVSSWLEYTIPNTDRYQFLRAEANFLRESMEGRFC